MNESHYLILIDDNAERCEKLKAILTFMGETHHAWTSREWEDGITTLSDKGKQALCTLIGSVEFQNGAPALLKKFSVVLPHTPHFLLDDKPHQDWPEVAKLQILGTLKSPLNYSDFVNTLHRAQIYREMYHQTKSRGRHRETNLFRSLVGTSRTIQQVRQMMQKVSETDANVMVVGETGTGKEVVARNLHYNSKRRESPFVPIHCSAIPAEIIEAELFGYDKGAFEGALSDKPGRLELANGGTLFLNDIADLSITTQAKLIRVLKDKVFERIGSSQIRPIDVRIIAASNQILEPLIENERFRSELFYLINIFPIEMPALRDRSEDLPLLINELIARMEHEKRGSIRFNSTALMALCQYDWPGNVRELANLVERMAILYPYGVVGVTDLPKKYRVTNDADNTSIHLDSHSSSQLSSTLSAAELLKTAMHFLPAEGLDLKDYLNTLEQKLIQQALDDAQGIVARAAERLKVRRTTLVEKMRKYGLTRPEEDLVD